MIEKRPIDEYVGAAERLPRHLRGVLPALEDAAHIGADIYILQKYYLHPFKDEGALEAAAKTDSLALDQRAIPDKYGKFFYYWEHPNIEPLLHAAQAKILSAASVAENVGERELGRLLYLTGDRLVVGDFENACKAYLKPLSSKLNFHFGFYESEGGKNMVQVYIGVVDQEKTSDIRKETIALREAGIRRKGGGWYTPSTEISVDDEIVVAGFLSSEAKRQRLREKGIEGTIITGFSAENIPNQPELAQKYGTRMIIFGASFSEVVTYDIARKSRLFMGDSLLPTVKGSLRFLVGHELAHDERYSHNLGWLHSALRESYANQMSIDLNAEVGEIAGKPAQIESAIRGGLGYSIRDCFELFTDRATAKDLEDMVDLSYYIPGSKGWINMGVREGAFAVKDEKVVGMNLDKTVDLSRRLVEEERQLLRLGTIQDVRDHFEYMISPVVFKAPTQQVA